MSLALYALALLGACLVLCIGVVSSLLGLAVAILEDAPRVRQLAAIVSALGFLATMVAVSWISRAVMA
jgi:amino acid permease